MEIKEIRKKLLKRKLLRKINNYTENELKAIQIFKNEKEHKITAFINELEKNSIDELQKRKIIKLKNDFNEIINEEDISESNSNE